MSRAARKRTARKRHTTQGVKKDERTYTSETKLYLALEAHRNRLIGFTDPQQGQTCHLGFTSLSGVGTYMTHLSRIGVLPSKEYRVLPTTFGEYGERLKAKFGNLDLVIDPPKMSPRSSDGAEEIRG